MLTGDIAAGPQPAEVLNRLLGRLGGELFLNGIVIREKRARGRPRKSSLAA